MLNRDMSWRWATGQRNIVESVSDVVGFRDFNKLIQSPRIWHLLHKSSCFQAELEEISKYLLIVVFEVRR